MTGYCYHSVNVLWLLVWPNVITLSCLCGIVLSNVIYWFEDVKSLLMYLLRRVREYQSHTTLDMCHSNSVKCMPWFVFVIFSRRQKWHFMTIVIARVFNLIWWLNFVEEQLASDFIIASTKFFSIQLIHGSLTRSWTSISANFVLDKKGRKPLTVISTTTLFVKI